MPDLDLAAVQEALASVPDPVFARPMAELGTLSNIQVDGDAVAVRVTLCSHADSLKRRFHEAAVLALRPTGARELVVEWVVEVPTREPAGDDPVPDVRNVILVMSGKGGVGKSTCATNLALGLARAGARVGLLDADIYGPSLPTMFGVHGHPHSTDGVRIEPLERFGIKLMSIGFLVETATDAVIWRGPMLQSALQQFLKDVNWGALDYLVLDLPPGTGDVALTLAQRVRSTGVVMVTTPQEVALQDVYKAVSMCQKLNLPVLGVVENMSYFIDSAGVVHHLFGQGGGEKIAAFAKAPLLAQLPIDPLVRSGGDEGTPVVQGAPDSAVAKAFAELADEVSVRIALHHFKRQGETKAPTADAPRRLKIVR